MKFNREKFQACYAQLLSHLGSMAEPHSVVESVESHRWYWRPEKPRLILLAESHVFTSEEPACQLPCGVGAHTAVRFVYCLGYGEAHIRGGTPEYWKLFATCDGSDPNLVLASRNADPIARRAAKLALLSSLKSKGIWLVDASIAGLAKFPGGKPKLDVILPICWDEFIGPVVREAQPEAIICIGQMVERVLRSRLEALRLPRLVIPQPNAHLDHDERVKVTCAVQNTARQLGLLARAKAAG